MRPLVVNFPGAIGALLIKIFFIFCGVGVAAGYLYYYAPKLAAVPSKEQIISAYITELEGVGVSPTSTDGGVGAGASPTSPKRNIFLETSAIELGWLDKLTSKATEINSPQWGRGVSPHLIHSPLGPPPCSGDKGTANSPWRVALTEAIDLAQKAKYAAASQRLDTFFAAPVNAERIAKLLKAGDRRLSSEITMSDAGDVGTPHAPDAAEGAEDLLHLAYLHLSYNRGTLWLKQGQYGNNVIKALRNAIGLAEQLLRWRGMQASMQELPIEAPGCFLQDHSSANLTTTDLYNNLIISYLLSQKFVERPDRVFAETRRDYGNDNTQVSQSSVGDNTPTPPLLLAPLIAYRDNQTVPQHWLWALSNAERVLHHIPAPNNPLLRYTLATVIGSILERGYQQNRARLQAKRYELLKDIPWATVPKIQRQAVIAGVIKNTVRQGITIPADLLPYLEPEQKAIVTAIAFVKEKRFRTPDWQNLIAEVLRHGSSQEVVKAFGNLANDWQKALRRDLTVDLLTRAANFTISERWQLADLLANLHRPEDGDITNALAKLRRNKVGMWLLTDRVITDQVWLITIEFLQHLFWSLLIFIIIALIGTWVAHQYRELCILFGSLYQLEAYLLHKARHDHES